MTATEESVLQRTNTTRAADTDAQHSRARVAEAIARLDTVEPALVEEIVGNEQLGKLSERTLDLLRQAQVPVLMLPESVGGLGMFPRDALEVLDRLCQIDASIGWIGGNWSTSGLFIATLGPEAGLRLMAGGQPLFGASGAPTGQATPVEGGYRVTGRWSYGSGDLQCDYAIVSALRMGADGAPDMPDGKPIIQGFVVEASDIQPQGNWDTLGLRATGSVDFTVEDAFVPDDFVIDTMAIPNTPDRQSRGGIWVTITMLHTAFSLGATRRLLDELIAVASRPSSRGVPLAENAVFRDQLARREIAARSARAFVYETWDIVDALMKAGEPIDRRTVTLIRASMVNMHEVARDLASFVFKTAGGTSLRSGGLQRWVRDTVSGCQHVIASDAVYPDVARELLGAPEDLIWSPLGLIAP